MDDPNKNTESKEWDELVGKFGTLEESKVYDESFRHLLEYAPDVVIFQILLNIPEKDLKYFCSINKRVRNVCRKNRVKEEYYKKYPIFKTSSVNEAQKYLKKNPKGWIHFTLGNDFVPSLPKPDEDPSPSFINLINRVVYLDLDDAYVLSILINKGYFKSMKAGATYTFANLKTAYGYEKGKLQLIVNFKDGMLNGKYKTYFSSGVTFSKITYVNGVQQGKATFYYADGKLRKEFDYEDGKVKHFIRWDRNGKIVQDVDYKEPVLERDVEDHDVDQSDDSEYSENSSEPNIYYEDSDESNSDDSNSDDSNSDDSNSDED
ncbi:MAG TPA: hypothetical protein PKD85_02595 [Saprospiraceae bacterium]|nr:hypothetical protein [Saprospiraceae bacterium]